MQSVKTEANRATRAEKLNAKNGTTETVSDQ